MKFLCVYLSFFICFQSVFAQKTQFVPGTELAHLQFAEHPFLYENDIILGKSDSISGFSAQRMMINLSVSTTPAICGLDNGQVILTISGGTPPYTVMWSNGATTEDLINVSPDSYIAEVEDAAGNTATISAVVEDNRVPINVTGIVEENIGCGPYTGAITLSIQPQVAPDGGDYIILWSNGDVGDEISELDSDDYFVTVTAGLTCEGQAAFFVPETIVRPAMNAYPEPALCGTATGSAVIEIFNGIPPFEFKWSNDSNYQSLGNVPPGSYTLTVTGQVGCTSTLVVVIPNEILDFDVNETIQDNSSCTQPDGSIVVSTAPTNLPMGMTYQFLWSNGATTRNIFNLAGGEYFLTVSPGGTGCNQIFSFDVDDLNALPAVGSLSSASTCGFANGNVNLNVMGGTPPYTFNWSNGASTQNLNNVLAGTYFVTVTDALGCTSTDVSVVPNNSLSPAITGTVTANTGCANPNGSILVNSNPAGGTFQWSNGSTNNQISGLLPGTYTVTTSVGVGCTNSRSFVVSNLAIFPSATENVQNATCGQQNGAIDLTPQPASSAPFTFLWSNGATTEDIAGLAIGNYSVTIIDSRGCQNIRQIQVAGDNTDLKIFASTTPVSDCSKPDGSIDLTVDPPMFGPYAYLWSNGATTQDLQNLLPGDYTVTITQISTNCPVVRTFNIQDLRGLPEVRATVQNAICGSDNGAIFVGVAGGNPPFSFEWSNGSIDETLTNIKAGSYHLDLFDANKCLVSFDFEVENENFDFDVSYNSSANVNCNTPNGFIELAVNPPTTSFADYVFSWNNGESTQNLEKLTAGNYSVTVSLGNSCERSLDISLADGTVQPIFAEIISPATCGTASGSIQLTMQGGTPPYRFAWSNGFTTKDLNNLLPGNYRVTVTGSNDCTAERSFTVLDQPILLNVSANISENTRCNNFDGGIQLNVLPPTGNYQFAWSNFSQNQNLQQIQGGQYTVTVTLGANCSTIQTFSVPENLQFPQILASATADTCSAGLGSINLSVSGLPNFQFLWSNGATTEDLNNLSAGNFSVTVTQANGCQSTENLAIDNVSNTFTFSATPSNNTSCSTPNGSISLVLNPPSGNYFFNWSNNATTQNLNNLPPGDYSVTISDGGACTAVGNFSVENSADMPQISGNVQPVLCFGNNTGSISVNILGGQPPYIFNWSPAITNLHQLSGGTYFLTLTDAAGCSDVEQFIVPAPASALQLICQVIKNTSATGSNDGEALITMLGGTAPYFLDWNPGSQQSNLVGGQFSLQNLAAGGYAVSLTDANGCTEVCSFQIQDFSCGKSVGTMSQNTLHFCGTACASANYDATQQQLGTGDALQFILHRGNANQILGEIMRAPTPNFCFDAVSMSFETTYYISAVVGTANGAGNVDLSEPCTQISVGTPVIFHEIPQANIASHADINCLSPIVNLVGSSSVSGSNFSWSSSSGGQFLSPLNQNAATVGAAATYFLIAEKNNCRDTAQTTVLDNRIAIDAQIVAPSGTSLDCKIRQLPLVGSASGAANLTFLWLKNGVFQGNNAQQAANEVGIWQLVALDPVSFCADTTTIEIIDVGQYPPLSANLTNTLTCLDTIATLTGNSTLSGIDFQWVSIAGNDTIVLATNNVLLVRQPGTYHLLGFNPANGCTGILEQIVVANTTPPLADAGADFFLDCLGGTKQLNGSASTGTGNLVFEWSTSNGQIIGSSRVPNPEIATGGSYRLVVTDTQNGCTDEDFVEIATSAPTFSPIVEQPKCHDGKGKIDFGRITGGTPPMRFSIDGGKTFGNQSIINNLSSGFYELVVQDAAGCEGFSSVTVAAPAPLTLFLPEQANIILGESYQIVASTSIPVDGLNHLEWSPADGSLSCINCLAPIATPQRSTRYQIFVEDTSGCKVVANIYIIVEKGKVFVPNIFSPNAQNTENQTFTIFGDPRSVRAMTDFQVFDRWGNLMFESPQPLFNDPASGWDGKFRGKIVQPGVYVWWVRIEFLDGSNEILKGDFLVK